MGRYHADSFSVTVDMRHNLLDRVIGTSRSVA
jgi:hypothetical protein